MPIKTWPVVGDITGYDGIPLDGVQLTLKFIPSAGGYAPGLLATKPVYATVSGGWFSTNLASTDSVTPAMFYTVIAEWLDPAGNFTSITLWEKIAVPAGGGNIGTFPMVPFSADDIWFSDDDPPAGWKGLVARSNGDFGRWI